MPHWASHAIDQLKRNKQVWIKPTGWSMYPMIKSKANVLLEPVKLDDLNVGDAVLCKVKSNIYLHKVVRISDGKVQIGNNKGHINGWTRTVYGRMIDQE